MVVSIDERRVDGFCLASLSALSLAISEVLCGRRSVHMTQHARDYFLFLHNISIVWFLLLNFIFLSNHREMNLLCIHHTMLDISGCIGVPVGPPHSNKLGAISQTTY
jgi:hypothetical protein